MDEHDKVDELEELEELEERIRTALRAGQNLDSSRESEGGGTVW